MTNLLNWLRSDWTHALVAAQIALAALVAAWGAYKAAYLKVVGRPIARTRWTLAADIAAELANNLLGAINKVLTARGAAPLFPPTPALDRAPSPPSSGQSGRSTVGAILVVVIAAVVTLLVALGLAVSGCDPSQHDPSLQPVTVFVSADWPARDRPDIEEALRALGAVGPSFVATEDATGADVVLRPWESRDCATDGAGQHLVGTRLAQVDRACAPGAGAFRAFVGHEVLHALGLLHVCTVHETGPDCSPAVRGSPAMMARSPFVDSGDPVIGLVAVDTPQRLDLEEYSRVRGR